MASSEPSNPIEKEEPGIESGIISASSSTDPSLEDGEATLEDVVPPEIVRALKDVPAKERKTMSMMLMGMSSFQRTSPIAEKIEPAHIGYIIENSDKESARDLEKAKSAENTKRLGMGSILALILMVLVYAGFSGDRELSEKIILAGISGLGGFGAGIAVGKQS